VLLGMNGSTGPFVLIVSRRSPGSLRRARSGLSLLARFFVAVAAIEQVSHYNSESSRQLAIRMFFVGSLRRVGRDRFHSCFLFSHTSESDCMV